MSGRALFGRGFAPSAEALLAALPRPLALVDPQGLAQGSNAAFRAALGAARPWRIGAPAEHSLPEAGAALAATREGRAGGASRQLAGIGTLVARPLGDGWTALEIEVAPPGAAREGAAPRLEILGRLAGGIAHDMNNLLGVVVGAAAAARRTGLSAPAEAEIAAIEEAARRGAGFVRQLLAFAGQQVMEPRVVALNGLVAALAEGLLPRLLGAGVQIELALEEPSRRVRVDPSQLDQVLLNLAVNARDAMGGSGRLRIATGRRLVLKPEPGSALPPGRYAVLEVADDGPGMSEAVAGRLFEPFFTTKPESGGTGLGLAIVQGIVEQSGGCIEVETALGKGARFRIYLPRFDGPEAAVPAPPPPPAEPAPARACGPILLVEDEPMLLRLAGLALEEAGHALLPAPDAEAALEWIEGGGRPALLVSDVAMPGLDGLGLARAVRARCPGLPVLLLSGYSAATVAADLGAENIRFLAKPYTPDGLRAAVAEALIAA